MEGTYCSFRSVNCFSRVVISSRHSILLLSQSSSSISVHMKTWQVGHHLHIFDFQPPPSTSEHLQAINQSKCELMFNRNSLSWWTNVWQIGKYIKFSCGGYLRPVFPTRAVSIFRHGRANSVLFVCAAAVLLGKIHLHFFVVAFFLLPGVNRHCDFQINR